MTHFDVYTDEMPNNGFSDQDIERLLSGGPPEDRALVALVPALHALHPEPEAPPEERVELFAARAAEVALAARPQPSGSVSSDGRSTRFERPLTTLRRKLATGLAAMLALSGMTGVAVASDAAAPGDALYGIDRALEEIGIGDGGAAERISEAQDLLDDGLVSEAIAHAAEAVPVEEDTEASELEASVEALRAAAASVTSADDVGEANDVRAKVSGMLSWMADNAPSEAALSGREFGQEVARFARSISGGPEGTSDRPRGEGIDRIPDEAGPNASEGGTSNDTGSPPDAGPPDNVPGPPQGTPGPPQGTPGPPQGKPGPPQGTPGRP